MHAWVSIVNPVQITGQKEVVSRAEWSGDIGAEQFDLDCAEMRRRRMAPTVAETLPGIGTRGWLAAGKMG